MMDNSQLSPRRPYLLRAMYQWLLDNNLTPHILVNIMQPGVSVPMEYANGEKIVLNIAPRAAHHLEIDNDGVSFSGRFGGISRQVSVPMAAVQAIYARENGAGTLFEQEEAYLHLYENDNQTKKKDKLTSIVDNKDNASGNSVEDDTDPPSPPPTRPGRPKLRIVK